MGKLCNFGPPMVRWLVGRLTVWFAVVLAAVLLAAMTMPLGATTLEKLSLPEMAQKSTAVVRARVTGSAGVLRGSDVYTVYQLDAVEVWKAPASGAPREVAVPGGIAGGLRQPVDGAPALVEGREYVLFLWTSRTGLTQLIGLSQGLFDVRTADGAKPAPGRSPLDAKNLWVWRSPASERMLDSQGRPVRDEAVSMKLTDLKTQVSRALTQAPSAAAAAREAAEAR
jgi:hypothetical protein